MARAFVTSPLAGELYLIQGEQPDTRDVEDARQWVTIYRELATFAERTLNRLRSGEPNGQAVALSHDADERSMEAHFRRLQSRLDFWEHRLWDLAGLDLDIRRGATAAGGNAPPSSVHRHRGSGRSEEHTSELQS